jgi:glycosyltransferase involved in cell wall biosynthesis
MKLKQLSCSKFYQECAGIFTMSEWLKKDLVQKTGVPEHKVHHVGGGCNVDITQIDDSRRNGKRFLYVGINWKRKNGELVVEAFEKLKTVYSCEALELYVVGPDEKPECIKEQKGIYFLGRLSRNELVEYYNLCDYFVMPSRYEAYGLVFAEALCFGLPCIGKNLCAMPEFIQEGENGYLIENDDADELCNAMGKLFMNGKEMADKLAEKRNFYVEKYSWNSVADRIIDVMRQDGFCV